MISSLKRDDDRERDGRAEALTHLLALELRLALFQERARPLAHVCGRRDEAEQRRLVDLCLVERHLEAAVDRFDDVLHRDGRFGGELRGQLLRSVISSAAGTTLLTKPIASASSALICRPVSSRSSAMPLPTSRARRCVPA